MISVLQLFACITLIFSKKMDSPVYIFPPSGIGADRFDSQLFETTISYFESYLELPVSTRRE